MADDFCTLIKEGIKEEKNAPKFYRKLKKATDCQRVKAYLDGIIRDEQGHAKMLRAIKKQECGGR